MKKTNEKVFHVTIMNVDHKITAYCYRSGYTNYETVKCESLGIRGSYSYQSRPWQEFTYDCALRNLATRAAKKYGRYHGDQITIQVIDREARKARGEAEAMFGSFKAVFDAASPATKDAIRESGVEVSTKEDVESLTATMKAMSLLEKIG